jgi:predicted nucleic acid-binding protein
MAIILLHTSVILDHLNGRNDRAEFLDSLVQEGHVLACCAINITEVYAGLRPGEETATEGLFESLEFLPITPTVARQAGLLRRDWRAKGQTLSYTDVTIAAVAIANQAPLLTDNAKQFPGSGPVTVAAAANPEILTILRSLLIL